MQHQISRKVAGSPSSFLPLLLLLLLLFFIFFLVQLYSQWKFLIYFLCNFSFKREFLNPTCMTKLFLRNDLVGQPAQWTLWARKQWLPALVLGGTHSMKVGTHWMVQAFFLEAHKVMNSYTKTHFIWGPLIKHKSFE